MLNNHKCLHSLCVCKETAKLAQCLSENGRKNSSLTPTLYLLIPMNKPSPYLPTKFIKSKTHTEENKTNKFSLEVCVPEIQHTPFPHCKSMLTRRSERLTKGVRVVDRFYAEMSSVQSPTESNQIFTVDACTYVAWH